VAQFETAAGASLFPTVYESGSSLGRPVYEASDMDGTYPSGNNYVLVFGDFDNFVVADRIGTVVEFVPTLFGANQRPTGQRGWFAWYRAGPDSVNDGGFRALNV
jgi:HK97 family phage major capsid protein